ncbi:MAG: acetate kinase [Chitinophagaceae bacterium]|nr:acetate kinase [Chitinophagaceae bacterium]
MNIFVINSGSSSIKYHLYKMPEGQSICSGIIDRIGLKGSVIQHKYWNEGEEKKVVLNMDIADHENGLREVIYLIAHAESGVLNDPGEIELVGHRIVHGGKEFTTPVLIDNNVKEKIKQTFQLAPLHNPPGFQGIEVAEKLFKNARQVAVFDTAFHQTMPEKAYRFAIPNSFYEDLNIRAYGFHGTSHQYVAAKAAKHLGSETIKLISIHLGNGASITAIQNGQSVDTSMGFGPLSGLVMGTRSGDIDPTVLLYLVNQAGYQLEEVSTLLNRESGMLGLTGYSDMRDITKSMQRGDQSARLAYDLYTYRIKKYIGAYVAALNGVDAIIFTAGVGENDAIVREMVCSNLDYLGIIPDLEKNSGKTVGIREIQSNASRVKILVIPTNEELKIAEQCFGLFNKGYKSDL